MNGWKMINNFTSAKRKVKLAYNFNYVLKLTESMLKNQRVKRKPSNY